MKKKFYFLILILFPLELCLSVFTNECGALYAQQSGVSIKGLVKDAMGEPLIGVNVMVEGTTIGGITDFDGNFALKVPSEKSTIRIAYVGYVVKKITVGKERFFMVVLEEDSKILDEVTVVAYGVQKKATLTGAISQIGTSDLLKSPSASVSNALAGALTGVSSVQYSGQPGADDAKLFIRGIGSLTEGSSSPLTLVDGVERAFSQLDPNEIENITVLKDASATAVFGVRGANGVVLVTTRRGTDGKTKIGISSSFGIQSPIKLVKFADSYTWAMGGNEIASDKSGEDFFKPWVMDALKYNKYPEILPNTDWHDYCFKDQSIQTQHNVTITGGTKSVKYFTSVGYLFQDGMFKKLPTESNYNNNFDYNRFNYRTNIDIEATKTTSIKLNIGGRLEKRNEPNAQSKENLWKNINWASPISGTGIVNGMRTETNTTDYLNGITLKDGLAPYYDRGYSNTARNILNIDYILTQKLDFITKGLAVEAKASYNGSFTYEKIRSKTPTYLTPKFKATVDPATPNDSTVVYVGSGVPSEMGYSEENAKGRDWYVEASVRYQRNFKKHNVSGLVLYNQSKKYYPSVNASIPTGYIGFVGRATYSYDNRYLIEVNAGYNGSENFAPGKTRYGLFPAISGGWVVSEEKFMKNQKVIDFLKLRGSAGFVGNDLLRAGGNIQRFLYMKDKYSIDNTGLDNGYSFGVDVPQKLPGAKEGIMGNPLVTWETSFKQNYGIDITMLGQRLSVSADIFAENRTDILAFRTTTPVFVAAQLPALNLGKVENKGWEASVKWGDQVGQVRYWINGNASFARNKIIYMDETPPNESYMWKTGKPVGTPFGRKFYAFYKEGLTYPNGKEIADHTADLKPGDAVYYDLNEDGKIDGDDEMAIGYPNRPEYTFGLRYGIHYKGFDLSMQWTGSTHVSRVIDGVFRIPYGGVDRWQTLFQYMWDERWTEETAGTAKAPRFSSTSSVNNYANSSLWIRDASYLRLKTIEVGYTFSKENLKILGMQSLRVYANAYNLLTLDKLKVVDPESLTNEGGDYPLSKIVNVGINIQF